MNDPTKREIEVLRLVSEGHTNQEIADMLFLSLNTVKRHMDNIMVKLSACNRTQAVVVGLSKGLISGGQENPSKG